MQEQDKTYAGFWVRLVATIIDLLLIVVITLPLLVSIYGWGYFDTEQPKFIKGPADFLISWVLPAIAAIVFWRQKQATPGKMVLSLRIHDAATGNKPSAGQCVGRYFAYLVSMLPLFLGFIWIAFDKRKQGWHDKLAGTVVVRSGRALTDIDWKDSLPKTSGENGYQMTVKKKILLGCGIVTALFAIAAVGILIMLMLGPKPGVKLSNEMDKYALQYLSDHKILTSSEDLVVYYDVTLKMDGTEAAILTTKRVIYHKDGRNDAIELTAIKDVQHRKESFAGDIIEIHDSSGKTMKIQIPPMSQGETFRSALIRAWENTKTGTNEQDTPVDADKPRR
jgi:uncharacterized RDD family membrane protein YckC